MFPTYSRWRCGPLTERFLHLFPHTARGPVLLQPQGLHPHHLHLPVQRAAQGGHGGAPQPAGLRLLPGGPAVAPVGAAVPLHAGAHGDGRPVREDARTGLAEEYRIGGAGGASRGRPAQVQQQVGGNTVQRHGGSVFDLSRLPSGDQEAAASRHLG